MGDLMQNRVPHLFNVIQQHQRPRKRNDLLPWPTRPEPPPGVVELKPPADQPMLPHELPSQIPCLNRMQRHPPSIDKRLKYG
jgi:hypothetical protein